MSTTTRPRGDHGTEWKDDPVVDALSEAISELKDMKKQVFHDFGNEIDDVLRRYVAQTASSTPSRSRSGRRRD